jgi:RecB family exonuclease
LKINHISVSRAETYLDCNQKYLYRYELGILPKETPFYFTFGKIAHKCIELYTEERGARNINEIVDNVLQQKIPIEGEDKFCPPDLDYEHRARLSLHLNNFMKLTDKIGTNGDVEWPFDVDVDPPNGRKWVGFIDRLITKGDKYYIIDYKTTKPGKWRKTRTTIRKDLQIQGYCYIVRNHFKVPASNIRAALYYLEDGTLIDSGHFTDETLDNVPTRLKELFLRIEKQDPATVQGRVGDHCGRCDYNNICPFYKNFRTGFSSMFKGR